MQASSSPPRTQKTLLFLGDKQTGKTSILQKYTKKIFAESYRTTLGVDFFTKEVRLSEPITCNDSSFATENLNTSVTLNMWDTTGSENENRILLSHFYKNACCFIICCSYDSAESLVNVTKWLQHIKSFVPEKKEEVYVFILCNKFDIPQLAKKFSAKDILRESKEILKFSSDFHIKIYHEVSAKENTNIDYVFNKIASLTSSFYCKNFNSSKLEKINTVLPDDKFKKREKFNWDKIENVNNRTFVLDNNITKSKYERDKCRTKCCK